MGIGKFKPGRIEKLLSKSQIKGTQLHEGSLVNFSESEESELYEAERRVSDGESYYCGEELWRFRQVSTAEIDKKPSRLIYFN